jgi:hypothetical protein
MVSVRKGLCLFLPALEEQHVEADLLREGQIFLGNEGLRFAPLPFETCI